MKISVFSLYGGYMPPFCFLICVVKYKKTPYKQGIKMIKDRDELGRIPQIWTVESAIEESKKYKTKKEFREQCSSAYQLLVRRKRLSSINLSGKRHRLSDFEVICAVKACKTWGEFRKNRPKEYSAFHKRKDSIPAGVYEHLGRSKTSKHWNKENISAIAKKYKEKSRFSKENSGAYDAALKLGIWNEVSSHMKSKQSDFDCLYVWTAKKLKNKRLVKIGVTSKRLGMTRVEFVEHKSGMKAIDLIIVDSKNAIKKEAELKKIGKQADVGVFSGSTEFFWVTERQYRKIESEINYEATI